MPNLGSFGNISPESMQVVRAALERRQQGGQIPAIEQQSQASPTASPLQPEAAGGGLPRPRQMSMENVSSRMPGNPEADLIVRALRDRLKAISSIETGRM